jgi:hypothetical protein
MIAAGTELAPGIARGQKKVPAWETEKVAPLTISCAAEPAVIKPGDAATIVATASSALNRPLSYRYSASAGVPTGTVNITCRVSDDQGRTATASVSVAISAPSAIHLPGDLIKNRGLAGSAVDYPPPPPPPPPVVKTPPPTKAERGPVIKKLAPVEQPVPVSSAKPPLPKTAQDLATQSAASAPSGEYAEGYAIEAWKKGLKQGQIEYSVPPGMKAQVKTAVSVRIHGFQDVAGAQSLPGATGNDTLKVSSNMKVELLALDPSEFTITPQDDRAVKYIPNDGYATWNWIVTPAHEAKNKQLEIRVSLVYTQPGTNLEAPLVDKIYTVNVEVEKLTTTVWQDFQKDPIAFFKYMLPGGAGWAALAALITSMGGLAWWKRKGKKKPAHRPHVS